MTMSISWQPEIGDPTWIGWITVVAYGISAWLATRTGRHVRYRAAVPPQDSEALWFAFPALLVFLGLNKQIDLQTLFFQVERQIALAKNWYEHRRLLQFI